MSVQLIASDCPRYESCNANICCADRDWRLRTQIQNEPTCHYLRWVAKDDAQGQLLDDHTDPIYRLAADVWQEKAQLPAALLSQLEKASAYPRKQFPAAARPQSGQRV